MKIVLHAAQFDKPFGVICSVITLSGYSHASIIDNHGIHWDSTFTRGKFGRAKPLNYQPEREIVVIDIPNVDPSEFIRATTNKKYDTIGLIFWPFKKQDPDKYYCFEAANECLKSVGIDLKLGKHISGKTILNGLLKKGYNAKITKGKYYDTERKNN